MKLAKALPLALVVTLGLIANGTSAQSLVGLFQLEEGARPLAMGGAFVGLADDDHALYYNPAGLASLRQLYVHGLFESRFARVSSGTVALALPNLGAQLLFLSVGGAIRRDERGLEQGALDYGQVGVLLGGGLSLDDGLLNLGMPLAMGLQLRVYSVGTLPGGSGTAFSLAPSLLFSQERLALLGIPVQSLRLGMIAPDLLSPGMTYGSGHRESWGPGLRLGAAAALAGGLTLAFDVEADGTFHLGGEWTLHGLDVPSWGVAELSVRAGLRNIGSLLAPSVGFGLRLGDVSLDYAFVAHSELPGVHRISLSAVLGPPNPILCALALRPEVCPPDDP